MELMDGGLLANRCRRRKFFDGAFRGYVRCKLTPQRWQSDYRVVSSIIDLNASVKTLATFVVQNGEPGAHLI